MKITIDIPDECIRDLIESADSGYWADKFKWITPLGEEWTAREGQCPIFKIREHRGTYERGDMHTVTRQMIEDGLVKMASANADEGGHHFACVLDDRKSDMWTGDALIQFATFGKLKYG